MAVTISTANSNLATRSGAGRPREPSRRKILAAEAEAELERQQQQPRKRKKGNKNDGNVENHAPVNEVEFQIETLPNNRTSKRAKNAIKLTAHTDGIPMVKATPAQVKAGQRRAVATAPAPTSEKRVLTAAAVAKLKLLRDPYVTPSRNNTSSSHVAPSATRSEIQSTAMRQDPATSGPPRTATPAPTRITTQNRQGQPPTNPTPSSMRTPAGELRRASGHRCRVRSPSPASREASPAPANGTAPPLLLATYHISSLPRADDIGAIPRIAEPYHIAALDDDDDMYTDPGEPYEDFAPNPRARAEALAFDPRFNIPNPAIYNEDFDDAERFEMDDDPDADLDADLDTNLDTNHDEIADGTCGSGFSDGDAAAEDDSPVPGQPILSTHAADDDEDQDMPEAQHNPMPPGKKAGARDYEPRAKEVLERAITIFKTHIVADDAYPDNLQERTWAKSAWKRAARDLDIQLKPDPRALELIKRYSWALRGEIKSFARNFVPGAYGFKQVLSTDAEGVQRNVELARELLEKNTFKYQDPHTRTGLFEGDIIQVIVNKVFYKNPSDDGVIHDDVYRPFPLRGVALVLTAIQCAIQEWSTGLHRNVNFDERIYEAEYKVHQEDLKGYEKQSEELKIVSAIRLKLAQYGRDHAKAPLTSQRGPSGGLPSDELARAVEAYRLKLQGS